MAHMIWNVDIGSENKKLNWDAHYILNILLMKCRIMKYLITKVQKQPLRILENSCYQDFQKL